MQATSTTEKNKELHYFPGFAHPAFHLLEYFVHQDRFYLSLKGGETLSFRPTEKNFPAFEHWLQQHNVHRVQLSKFRSSSAGSLYRR